MEVTIKITKKRIILFLVAPIVLVAAIIYLYFFWGKPLDVSHEIWIRGKQYYEVTVENKLIEDLNDRKEWGIKIAEFMYENEGYKQGPGQSGYSENEVKIISSMDFIYHDYSEYCPDSELILYVDEERCESYKTSVETLADFYE